MIMVLAHLLDKGALMLVGPFENIDEADKYIKKATNPGVKFTLMMSVPKDVRVG